MTYKFYNRSGNQQSPALSAAMAEIALFEHANHVAVSYKKTRRYVFNVMDQSYDFMLAMSLRGVERPTLHLSR